MTQKIVIAGSGFAGLWSAVSAARAVSLTGKKNQIEITVVSPTPSLHIRPRLYETVFEEMAPNLKPLFDAIGVRYLGGTIEAVHTARHEVGADCCAARGLAMLRAMSGDNRPRPAHYSRRSRVPAHR